MNRSGPHRSRVGALLVAPLVLVLAGCAGSPGATSAIETVAAVGYFAQAFFGHGDCACASGPRDPTAESNYGLLPR